MTNDKIKVVAIDGPSASGKSSLSRSLSRERGWPWVSTGAFYRGLAYYCLQKGVDANDAPAVEKLCASSEWKVVPTFEQTQVWVSGKNITEHLIKQEIGDLASKVSRHPSVRASLLSAQRDCLKPGSFLIAEGRDCGSVVFPHAFLKIFLTASEQSRAQRRADQVNEDLEDTLIRQLKRDQRDQNRANAPLKISPGSLEIDSTHFTQEEVLGLVNKEIDECLSRYSWK